MATKKTPPKKSPHKNGTKTSKKAQAEAWIRANPKGNAAEFTKATGVAMHPTYFSALKSGLRKPKVNGNGKKVKVLKAQVSGSTQAVKVDVLQDREARLKEENAYLQWSLQGERNGYINRLKRDLNLHRS